MEERTLEPHELEGPTTITEKEPLPPSSDDDDYEEFEFPFVSRDSPAGTAAPADELFADGRIRPFYFYPAVFGHGSGPAQVQPDARPAPRARGRLGTLFLEESRERNSSSSVSSDDNDGDIGLDGAQPESYCLWTPASSSPPRKSSSTGSSTARWRRISELVVGRSRSDGKDKFIFFPAPTKPKEEFSVNKRHDKDKHKTVVKAKPSTASGRKAPPAEVDTVAAAHRIAYVANKGGGGGTPRRTFLPYREELVGFFANVNGISRSHHHPF